MLLQEKSHIGSKLRPSGKFLPYPNEEEYTTGLALGREMLVVNLTLRSGNRRILGSHWLVEFETPGQ